MNALQLMVQASPAVFVVVAGRDESFNVQISKREAFKMLGEASATQFKMTVLDSAGTLLIERNV
jgi:hypothetical protein